METPFTPEELQDLSLKADSLISSLRSVDTLPANADSEQHFLIALSLLQQASAHLKLAQYSQSRSLRGLR